MIDQPRDILETLAVVQKEGFDDENIRTATGILPDADAIASSSPLSLFLAVLQLMLASPCLARLDSIEPRIGRAGSVERKASE